MKNKFYNYLYNAGVPVVELYAPLNDWTKKFVVPAPNNFWQIIISVSNFISKYWEFEPWYPEKVIFSLIERGLIDGLAMRLESIESLLTLTDISPVVGTKVGGKFISLDLNDSIAKRWENAYSAVDPKVKKRVDSELSAAISLFTRLKIQLQTVNMLLTLPLGPALYSTEEIRRFVIDNGSGCEFVRLIFTLREMSITDARHEVYLIAKEFLATDACIKNEDIEWERAVLLAWALGFMFDEFKHLPSEDRIWLMENYFYRAIAAGVPVRQFLQSYLLSSRWVVEYVQRNAAFALSIENNLEQISVEQEATVLSVGLFCASYNKTFLERLLDEQSQDGFVRGIVAETAEKDVDFSTRFHPRWLKEVLYLYSHIKEAVLVDWMKDGDSPLNYENKGELMKLLAYFAYDGEFERAIEYFKDEKSKVPLRIFLEYLREAVGLEDVVNAQNGLSFTEALREAGLLPANQDIIEYHEQDGQFHWNEDIKI